jgi:hypothetical protein
VSGVGERLTMAVAMSVSVLFSTVWPASAEDLVMPFACNAAGGEVQISPSNETSYKILGHRDEQSFVACAGSDQACETMMVHRFAIACDGQKISWSRIANAAKAFGAAVPAGLPNGFAPVSTLSGRFVLPALTHIEPQLEAAHERVAMQDLSPDSVIEGQEGTAVAQYAEWVTEVKADAAAMPRGNALRVASALSVVMALLLAASMAAAGRWRIPWPSVVIRRDGGKTSVTDQVVQSWQRVAKWLSKARDHWADNAHDEPGAALHNALSFAQVRYTQIELSLASLAAELLLRDVLSSELQQIRERLSDVERQLNRRPPGKSAAIIRGMVRDLDRIGRISQSAGEGAQNETVAHSSIPQSIADAYRVLGMNSDATPAIAKKLVDALRMSWHPDHARDELDRRRREDRMKQINAAWDMIKNQRAAA